MKFEKDKYINGFLKSNLDLITKRVNINYDGILYVAGYEGDGKTTLASQICYYLDNSFNLDRVVFTAKQFSEAINEAKPKTSILFDESYMTFNTGARMTKETREVKGLLTMIRKKQLYIIIVAPTVFDIDYYIICFRSLALINVYAKGLQRGFFAFYNREQKEKLYIKGKKTHDMKVAKPNFLGNFTKWNILDSDKYEKKKDDAIKKVLNPINKRPKCPQCDSRDVRFNHTKKKTTCRVCGHSGRRGEFIYIIKKGA